MSDSFDRLLAAAKNKHSNIESVADLARALNESDQTLNNWSRRGVSNKGALAAEHSLGIDATWVLLGEASKFVRSAAQPPRIVERADVLSLPPTRPIPVVGEARLGAGGEYQYTEGSIHGDGFVAYPTNDKNAYALRCKGDSMQPRINHGEFVIVLPNEPVRVGKDVAVRTRDGRQMIKRLMLREGGIIKLFSVNLDHDPITLEEHEIETIHRVGGVVDELQFFSE